MICTCIQILQRSIFVRWSAPPSESLKVNIDIATKVNDRHRDPDIVARDSVGCFVGACSLAILGIFSLSKVIDVRHALFWIKKSD